ncbi:hypothetical protein J7L02_03940 [Candidatus Woesearchaeota archaeon]|nr:hypothetical protein [Candidatus Woesearchaeota archaeon]
MVKTKKQRLQEKLLIAGALITGLAAYVGLKQDWNETRKIDEMISNARIVTIQIQPGETFYNLAMQELKAAGVGNDYLRYGIEEYLAKVEELNNVKSNKIYAFQEYKLLDLDSDGYIGNKQ